MKLSISELIQLKSVIHTELNQAKADLQKGAYNKTLGDDVLDQILIEDFEATYAKVIKLDAYLIEIGSLVTKLNLETELVYEEGSTPLTIREALELAKTFRSRAHIFKTLGQKQKLVVETGGRFSTGTEGARMEYVHDIEHFKKEEARILRLADRISRAVERASVVTEVEIDDKFEEYR